jgi:SAM-dependent methyltransferase
MNNYYHGVRSEVSALLPKAFNYKNVLEIGGGDGAFVKSLNQNCNYHILEPEPVTLLYPGRVNKIYRGTFEDVLKELPDNYFDLVVCNDVIEHMTDHDLFFSKIKSKMSINGRILGSVPNVRYVGNIIEIVIKKDWKYENSGFFDRTHFRFFTKKSLERTFNEHNYIIENFKPLNRAICINLFSIKCIFERVIVMLLGNDSKYIQLGFLIRK